MLSIILSMSKLQENPKTKALLVQIPKAIAEAKGWKKGTDIKFKIENESGRIYLDEGTK